MKTKIFSLRLDKETKSMLDQILENKNTINGISNYSYTYSDVIREIINYQFNKNINKNSYDNINILLNNKMKKLLDLLEIKNKNIEQNLIIIKKLLAEKFNLDIENLVLNNFKASNNLIEIEKGLENDE